MKYFMDVYLGMGAVIGFGSLYVTWVRTKKVIVTSMVAVVSSLLWPVVVVMALGNVKPTDKQ